MRNIYLIQLFLFLFPFYCFSQTVEKEEYLIITRPVFLEALKDFVAFKQANGLNVKVSTVEEVIKDQAGRDVQEKIRNYIISEYRVNNQKWLLLVGKPDSDDNLNKNGEKATVLDKEWEIPIRYIYSPAYEDFKYVPSDMYYAGLDGTWDCDMDNLYGEWPAASTCGIDEADWFPEISVGRVPSTNTSQVKNYFDKIIKNDYSKLPESEIKSLQVQCKVILGDPIDVGGKILAGLPEYEPPTRENLLKYINSKDFKILTYTGHGNKNGIVMEQGAWGGDGLTGKPFFMYSSCCSTGEVDTDNKGESLAEKLLFQENTGAVGFIGANTIAYPYNMNDLWDEFWRVYYDDAETSIGRTLNNAKVKYQFYHVANWFHSDYRYLALTFNLYGDPALKIGEIKPNGPIINSISTMTYIDGQYYKYAYGNHPSAKGDGEITWSKVNGAEYFNIMEDGLIEWFPRVGVEKNNNGRPEIVIKATDKNGSTIQKFEVGLNYSGVPKITSKPNIFATINENYNYDEDRKPNNLLEAEVRWQLLKGPEDFSIDRIRGEIKWVPHNLGTFEVVIAAFSKAAIPLFDFQQYYINVNPANMKQCPVADFYAEKHIGWVPFPVSVKFHDTSLGPVKKWKWDFGDGTTSYEQNPVHSYMKSDSMNVKLVVYNDECSDSIIRKKYAIILPEPPPVANFTANNRISSKSAVVQFTNLTTNTSTNWNWDFGDGEISVEKNPLHTYSKPGSYNVKLVSASLYGTSEKIKSNYINVYETLRDTVIAHWKFEEQNDILVDAENGLNGKINGANWNTKCTKSSLIFDGVNDYVQVEDNENFNPDFITLEAMVKIRSHKLTSIVDRWGPWGQYSIGLGDFYGRSVDHLFFSVPYLGIKSVSSKEPVPLNQWIHIAGVFDGDSIRLFMNGKQVGSAEVNGKIYSQNATLTIGCGEFGAYITNPIVDRRYFDGEISEVRISRYPLQPTNFFKQISNQVNNVIIKQNGDVLHSDASTGNQWYNSSGIIIGATSQDYTPKVSGEYYVVATTECGSATSNKIKLIPTGIGMFKLEKPILQFYPNPATSELTIKYLGNTKVSEFELINSTGQVIYKGNLIEETTVPMGGFTPGIYIVKLVGVEKIEISKVIKIQ